MNPRLRRLGYVYGFSIMGICIATLVFLFLLVMSGEFRYFVTH